MKDLERFIYIAIIISTLIFAVTRVSNVEYKVLSGDTIFSEIVIEKPIPYDTIIYKYDTVQLAGDTVFLKDTVFVYNDYFKMFSYKLDTITSEVNVSCETFITQNRLYKQSFNIKNNRETSFIVENKNTFGVGITVGRNILAPSLSYQINQHEFGIGVDIYSKSPLIKYEYKFKK